MMKRTNIAGAALALLALLLLAGCPDTAGGGGGGGAHAPAGFVRVPGGAFTMGCPAAEVNPYDTAETRHRVRVSPFYMGKYEVTQAEFAAVMGSNPSYFDGTTGKAAAAGEAQEQRPVEMVSWYDAVAYCNKRSVAEGKEPVYSVSGINWTTLTYSEVPTDRDAVWDAVTQNKSKNGYRLPTEAEWEYACRAGTTTAYNTGARIADDAVWYSGTSGGKTHEVGKKAANAWGLYDMHGNVWEWCWDWYGEYGSSSQIDPVGPRSGVYCVGRGGAWSLIARSVRSAYRGSFTPANKGSPLGFRVVRGL